MIFSLIACNKKSYYDEIIENLESTPIQSELLGRWQLAFRVGGWSSAIIKPDSTKPRILSIFENKKFKECENKNCYTEEWFHGKNIPKPFSSTIEEVLVLKENKLEPFKGPRTVKLIQDTLIVFPSCNDCGHSVYIKMK
jgi:hypothetical protein